jgi:hypothetical protein
MTARTLTEADPEDAPGSACSRLGKEGSGSRDMATINCTKAHAEAIARSLAKRGDPPIMFVLDTPLTCASFTHMIISS